MMYKESNMAWIRTIKESEAESDLAQSYQRYREPSGQVDGILKIHSLNPPSLEAHYRLYAHLMRGPSGLTRLERELIAVAVSKENGCHY
jgi:alkylhydroperoxidase family enzyme